jgi:hypothetical protein
MDWGKYANMSDRSGDNSALEKKAKLGFLLIASCESIRFLFLFLVGWSCSDSEGDAASVTEGEVFCRPHTNFLLFQAAAIRLASISTPIIFEGENRWAGMKQIVLDDVNLIASPLLTDVYRHPSLVTANI